MRQPPTTIQYHQQTYTLLEAQSSEPVQRAHDRIQSLIDRGKDPVAGTLRRLWATNKPAKVHGIIQAARELRDRAKTPRERDNWHTIVQQGHSHHERLTGKKYHDSHYDTPEKVKPAKPGKTPRPSVTTGPLPPEISRVVRDELERKPRKKKKKKKSKLPTSVSKPGKKGPSTTVQAPGQSKWVRVIRKRDGKIIQVRRGAHLNKKKYAPLKKQQKAASVTTAPPKIQYHGQEYVLEAAASPTRRTKGKD